MFKILFIVLVVLLLPWAVSDILAQDNHDHDHASEEKAREDNDHAHEDEYASIDDHGESDDHADSSNHEGHRDELAVTLTPEAVKLADIKISTIKHGRIERTVELPGEIGFTEDRLAHIAPRFAGIALQTNYKVGDYVDQGDTVAIIESNESMNSYSIAAPISGWIIERHITPGEFVSEENSIYVIADLSEVWVNLAVYPKDINIIKKGQVAHITAIGSKNTATGSIEYVTPIMDSRTRSATARITLLNPDNIWRPGAFVQAAIVLEAGSASLMVEKNAVQYLKEKNVLFVVDGPNTFRPVDVVIGDSDANYIQIIGDLSEGTRYASSGAFELKAKIVTSNLDAHAGHGH